MANSSCSVRCFIEHFPEQRNWCGCVRDAASYPQIACFKGTGIVMIQIEHKNYYKRQKVGTKCKDHSEEE